MTKKLMTVLCGLYVGFATCGALVAAEEAAEAVANTETGGALVDFLQKAASFLPFPWNVCAASVVAAAAAVFTWKKASPAKKAESKEPEKTDAASDAQEEK